MVQRLGPHVVQPLDGDQAAPADDADPSRDPLHLAQHVRAEQHGPAAGGMLREQGVELPLHHRVEAARRLVEHEQVRPRHEGENQGELLPVAP